MLTDEQRQLIDQLYETRKQEQGKSLKCLNNNAYIRHLFHESSAKKIGEKISKLLDLWLGT